MRRGKSMLLGLCTLAVLAMALPAFASEEIEAPGTTLRLRRWHLGLQALTTWRNRYDVFGLPDVPPAGIADRGHGLGFVLGRRFGDRFLLQGQVTFGSHELREAEAAFVDVEALLTGTVLFRARDTVQPFLRGGFGGGGEIYDLGTNRGHVFAYGPAVLVGGGVQVRLGSRVSLELELAATFNNLMEVHDETSDDLWSGGTWQVRVSNWGWRSGAGVVLWF